jgi:hypothetical protein
VWSLLKLSPLKQGSEILVPGGVGCWGAGLCLASGIEGFETLAGGCGGSSSDSSLGSAGLGTEAGGRGDGGAAAAPGTGIGRKPKKSKVFMFCKLRYIEL